MRRTIVVVTAWITATVLAVTLAFAGVNLVADRVLEPQPAPVIGSAALDDPSDEPTDEATPDDEPSDDATPDDEPSDDTTPDDDPSDDPTASSTPRTSPTDTPSPSDGPSPDDEPSDEPTPRATASPSASPTASPSSGASTAPAETRTYRMTGGTVTVRFSSTEVRVVSATPNEGFSLHEIEQPAPTVIDLEFRAHDDSHRSKLDAWWQDGPRERIREETRD